MKRKYLVVITFGLLLIILTCFYIINNKNSVNTKLENRSSEKIITQKTENSIKNSPHKLTKEKNKDSKDMTPEEYVTWLKDPNDRVLLEIRPEGTKLYRKENVMITVTPNGEELYLPDEF